MKVVLAILAILLVIGWWQNEKEAAAKENRPTVIDRIFSDSPATDVGGTGNRRPMGVKGIFSGPTESEKALRHPESMTPEQRQLATEWGNGAKRLYVEQVDALEGKLSARMEGGYVWGQESERRARASIRALNDAIDRDDFLAVPAKFSEAKESLRLFEAGCRWRAGLRHPSIPHITSGAREGYWNADQGWHFLRQGSLEVVRNCHRCNGSGRETVMVTCDRCNGTGRIATPLSGVTGAIEDISGLVQGVDDISRALKGKPSRGGHRHHSGQSTMICNQCNGRRRREALQPCSVCGGQGWTR